MRHQGSEVVLITPADALNGNGDVGRALSIVTDSDFGSDEIGLLLLLSGNGLGRVVRSLSGQSSEVLFGEFNKLLVGNATSTNEHHAVSGVVGLDVVFQVLALDGLDVLLGAKNGTSEGLALECGSVQVVEDNLLKLLVNLLLFPENNVALTLDSRGVEL